MLMICHGEKDVFCDNGRSVRFSEFSEAFVENLSKHRGSKCYSAGFNVQN